MIIKVIFPSFSGYNFKILIIFNMNTGIIYCIREISNDKIIYVGSTVSKLKSRASSHKTDCYYFNKPYKIYQYIKNIAPDRKNFDKYFVFETLQTVNFDEKEELLKVEEQYLKTLPDLLNQQKAFQSEEELREYMHNYRIEHREKNNEYYKKYSKSDKWREYHR